MEVYKNIVKDFKLDAWKSNPFERMLKVKEEEPQNLLPFLTLCLSDIPKGGTFFDAALSYISEKEFKELIGRAIELSRQIGWTEVTCSVIDYASLQFPSLLLEYLPELLNSRSSSYYDKWVWRNSNQKEMNFLIEIIQSNSESKNDAWECLVNIRNETAILKAQGLFDIGCPRPEIGFDIYSKESGFEVVENSVRKLYQDATYHIIFNDEYLNELELGIADSVNYAALSRKNHPTWTFEDSDSFSSNFGGLSSSKCGSCGGHLHHLLDVPEGLLDNHNVLSLETCLSCLGWEEDQLFYKHNSIGIPTPIENKLEHCVPEFESLPLKKTKVSIVKTPDRWGFQDWGLSNSRENLHRLGGSPSWIQGADYPSCPSCKDTMKFCAQFDSELLMEDGEEWLWGSGGICYTFFCVNCEISGMLWQCT